ncbi:MAG: FliM/FliN family flagellar motor switch protein [Gammaproteobacteria bacterium]
MNTREILSEDESQALRAPSAAGDPQGRAPEGQVVDLHADHWERIASDKVPALESISERMTSLLKLTARKFFRQSVEVSPRPWREERWGLYSRRLPVPTSLNVIEVRAQNLKGVITLDSGFVFTLVDIFFGGDGKGRRTEGTAEFTPMEIRLVRKFVTLITQDMRDAWKPFVNIDFQLGASEINPIFAAVAATSEAMTVTGFDLTLSGQDFRFEIALPDVLMEPIRHLRDAGQPDQAEADSRRWSSRLKADVQDAQVSLRAVVARTEISLRDLVEARPGDIIPTDLLPAVILYAGDTPLVEGTFGAFQGRNAVRITKPANRITVGEKYGRDENA